MAALRKKRSERLKWDLNSIMRGREFKIFKRDLKDKKFVVPKPKEIAKFISENIETNDGLIGGVYFRWCSRNVKKPDLGKEEILKFQK